MSDHRRHERKSAAFHAEIRRRDSGEILGNLADISDGGLMLTTEQPLTVDAIIELEIELPRDSVEGTSVVVPARVRWCEPDLAPGVYAAGLEFIGDGLPSRGVYQQLRRRLGD
jgi:hypothetical protein